MIFIFEDNKKDIISTFFMSAYPDYVSKQFVYTEGNSNICDKASEYLTKTNETIVVFLDTVPGNRNIYQIYSKLKFISKRNQYRLIVLPIVCAEYYLIKSLVNTQVMIDDTGVDICINKDVYFNSPLLKTSDDFAFCKNFEKYCKLILIKNLKYCARHSGKTINKYYATYYKNDCICNYSEECCLEESILDKGIRLLKQYPCIPSGSLATEANKLAEDNIWDIHRKLVQEFNDMVRRYRNVVTDNTNTAYKEIKAFR